MIFVLFAGLYLTSLLSCIILLVLAPIAGLWVWGLKEALLLALLFYPFLFTVLGGLE